MTDEPEKERPRGALNTGIPTRAGSTQGHNLLLAAEAVRSSLKPAGAGEP